MIGRLFGFRPQKRVVSFAGAREKADFLDAEASRDSLDPLVRDYARRVALAGTVNDEGGIAQAIQRFVRDCVPYVRDPSWEEFSETRVILGIAPRPSGIVQAGGDCDDKARAFVALARAVGIHARILPNFAGDDFVHVQAQVSWPNVARYARARGKVLEEGNWLRAELILQGCELGDDPAICGWDRCKRRLYTDGHG